MLICVCFVYIKRTFCQVRSSAVPKNFTNNSFDMRTLVAAVQQSDVFGVSYFFVDGMDSFKIMDEKYQMIRKELSSQ